MKPKLTQEELMRHCWALDISYEELKLHATRHGIEVPTYHTWHEYKVVESGKMDSYFREMM